jgi:NADPH-dependent glutamate synthase beta subunit-like oxidoreductase/Pyruvate/2-oxoacid:ferredoxin oxidoreductase delta subunit/bacterioferritin-associated ferredoxin
MKEVRTQAVVDSTRCSGCDTCIHVCPTMAYFPPQGRPIDTPKLPPCNANCPIGNDIEGVVTLIQQDKWDAALDLLRTTNPLPGITGRVCDSPCEAACNRGGFDQPVHMKAVERALADYAAQRLHKSIGDSPHRHKERVAIIGSGPAGLSCGYHLARKGFRVTIIEQKAQLGGILRYGIPSYRLPKNILDGEIDCLRRLGVEFKINQKWDLSLRGKEIEDYEAIFLAPGLQKNQLLGIAGERCEQVMPGLAFLAQVNSGKKPELGRTVLVVGGGNSAVDAARSVRRLGIKPTLVYRRREEDMPAIKGEVEDLKGEGVEILTLTTPVRFILKGGRLAEAVCVKMELSEFEADGRKRPVPIPGSEFTIPAETVIHCIGETGDLQDILEGLKVERERIVADPLGQTSKPKVFAGGDIITDSGTVAHAIGSGRRAAQSIMAYLLGESDMAPSIEKPLVTAAEMNFDYLDPVPRVTSSRIPMEKAISGFDETHHTVSREEAVSEAARCLHCGVIPEFHAEYCRGCTNCSSRCPTYAISVKELESPYVVRVDIEEEMIEEICRICEKALIHPESLVCQCTGTRADEIVAAILKGAATVVDIRRMTGAHTGCGSACISPMFHLMKASGLEVASPPQPDMYYPEAPTIWDIPDHVIRDFEARGFRFEEDKDFYNNWLCSIRTYCGKKP